MTELFPDAQCGIGPPTEDGFFYDFLVSRPFTPEDLAAIEKKMAHIVKQNRPIEKKLIPKAEALELFARQGPDAEVPAHQGEGGRPGAVLHDGGVHRLLPGAAPAEHEGDQGLQAEAGAVSQSYWKGREGNPAMQRIYGYAFFTQGGAGPAPPSPGGGQAPRPPQAGTRAGPLLGGRRDGRRPDPLAPQGRLHPQADRGLLARRAPGGRLRHRLHAAHRQARPVEDERAHRVLQGRTCTRRSRSRTSRTSSSR